MWQSAAPGGYRKAKEWQAAGAWLTFVTGNYHHTEKITIPADAPPGRYLLRLRAGGNPNVPVSRRFLETGTESADDFHRRGVFQVTATIHQPQVIEVPVMVASDGPRAFSFREKFGGQGFQNAIARATNGVGLDCALWIDWVEWEGPLPDNAGANACLHLFGSAFPTDPDTATLRTILDRVAMQAFRGIRPDVDYIDRLVDVYEGQRAAGKSFADALVEPLANLWLTLLQGVGIETDSFGDSTGALSALTA